MPKKSKKIDMEELEVIGARLAAIFLLQNPYGRNDRWMLGEGHCHKSNVGLARLFLVIAEQIQAGTFH